jgi:hypothetical protein
MKSVHLVLTFLVFAAGFFFLSGSHRMIDDGPRSVHAWRQADCASYAKNYFQNQQPFLQPQVFTQTGTNGYTVSEFPVIYFFTGKLYHVFGFMKAYSAEFISPSS